MNKTTEILKNLSSLADLRKFETIIKNNEVIFYRVESKFFGFYQTHIAVCVVQYVGSENTFVINLNKNTKPIETVSIIEIVNLIGGIYNSSIKSN